jgi:beta-lactamase superfamily II metal-dependent hydrolase
MAGAEAGRHQPGSTDVFRIRMYNVGFGDCFLLFVPTEMGERAMLLDCGKHLSSKTGHTINQAAQDILNTVSTSGTPRLDVVVATHRHYDHVSGYALKLWDQVEVGEVWMPWTEEVGNPAADTIRRDQNRLAHALRRKFASTDTAIGALAFNSLSNKDAEARLRTGFAGKARRRYLPEGDGGPRVFTTDMLPGVRVHVLGPSHDRDVIADMVPPKGMYFPDESTDRAAASASPGAAPPTGSPGAAALRANSFFPEIFAARYHMDAATFGSRYAALAEHTDSAAIDERSKKDMLAAAADLEDAINGTSLVFALEFGDVCILLAGDAEWGTWSQMLADPSSRAVLARTRAYKVSHHGSYNGTPKTFVDDLLRSDALSLVSLGPMEKWPSIPRTSLLEALELPPRRLMRSDHMPLTGEDVTSNGTLWAEVSVPRV